MHKSAGVSSGGTGAHCLAKVPSFGIPQLAGHSIFEPLPLLQTHTGSDGGVCALGAGAGAQELTPRSNEDDGKSRKEKVCTRPPPVLSEPRHAHSHPVPTIRALNSWNGPFCTR
jgi:hypothetical protein